MEPGSAWPLHLDAVKTSHSERHDGAATGPTDPTVSRATLDRGRSYARTGRVLMMSGAAEDGITAKVRSSGGVVYRLEARVEMHRGAPLLWSQCSCPVGVACKYVVAALIVATEQERAGGPPAG